MKRFILPIGITVCSLLPIPAWGQTQQLVFGYSGEPLQSVGTEWQEYTALVEFPEKFVDRFDGAEVIAVEIASPNSYENPEVNRFLDIDLEFFSEKGGQPFFTQEATLSEKGFDWKRIMLSSPVQIENGKPFYVGYSGKAPTIDDACFAVDLQYNEDNLGMWLGWIDELSGEQVWEPYTEYYGNLCLRLVIEGDHLPSDELTLEWVYPPLFATTGSQFSVVATVVNNAANDIGSLGIAYEFGEEIRTVDVEVDPPLKYNEMRDIEINGLVCSQIGNRIPMSFTIESINGNNNPTVHDEFDDYAYLYSIPEGSGYERNVVVEEGTGTWCGYCPLGIVGMEYMSKKYTDGSFIPVAIHGSDPMESDSYIKIAKEYFNAYPSAIANRDTYRFGVFTPDINILETAYTLSRSIPAFAEISLEADYNDDSRTALNVNTSTTFAISSSDTFSVAFAITADNIGPYIQTNYFADNAEGEMGGWESKPESVPTYYNHVAQGYFEAGEIGNNPGEPHMLTSSVPLDFLPDRNDFTLIAMVVNNATGDIENAAMLKSCDFSSLSSVGIEVPEIIASKGRIEVKGSSTATNIYSPDGRLAARILGEGQIILPSGIYIVNTGTHNVKVAI